MYPGSILPAEPSRSNTRAPASVAIQKTVSASMIVGSRVASFWSRIAAFISANMSWESLDAGPSVATEI